MLRKNLPALLQIVNINYSKSIKIATKRERTFNEIASKDYRASVQTLRRKSSEAKLGPEKSP